jgi:hypothetical protein
MLPHTLVGIGMLVFFIYSLAAFIAICSVGERFPGEITSLSTTRGNKGGTTYHVNYRYEVDGTRYSESESVSADIYHRLKERQKIEVDALRSWPTWCPQPVIEGHSSAWGVLVLAFFATFWNAIVGVFLWALFVQPLRLKKLVQTGWPAVGTIISTEMRSGKSTTYLARYRFQAAPTNPEHKLLGVYGECMVPKEMYASIKNGEQVTVLYDPNRPKSNLVYEYADYRAVVLADGG